MESKLRVWACDEIRFDLREFSEALRPIRSVRPTLCEFHVQASVPCLGMREGTVEMSEWIWQSRRKRHESLTRPRLD